MAARAIREVQGLNIVYNHINSDKSENGGIEPVKFFALEKPEDVANAETEHPWIKEGVRTVDIKIPVMTKELSKQETQSARSKF